MSVGFVLFNLPYLAIGHLEAHAEREGEGDDDQEPGDGGEEPAAHPNACVRVIS